MKIITRILGLVLLVALGSFVGTAAALTVRGQLVPNAVLPDLALLTPNVKVVIDGGRWHSYVTEDGDFYFPNIPAGSHLLTVVNHRYNFDMIRLDITDDTILASLTHNGASWDTLGPITMYPLALQAKAKYEFFAKREGFNAWSILSNPMILMSGVTLLMVFVMPKMMANMPEEVKQGASGGQQQVQQPETPQISMPDISQNLANWFAPKPQTSTGPTSANRRRA